MRRRLINYSAYPPTHVEREQHYVRSALHVGASALKELICGNPREGHVYGAVIVGSGGGGGAVAHQLHCADVDTLLIEAGTATGGKDFLNCDQRHQSRASCRTVYETVARSPSLCSAGSRNYVGGDVHVLGGKTRLWGGLSPRPKPWEMRAFPESVSSYLANEAVFEAAERLMRVSSPQTPLQDRVRQFLGRLFPDWTHEDAPYAVRSGPFQLAGPSGMYNTGDLLIEEKIERMFQRRRSHIDVVFDHEVTRVQPHGDGPVDIYARNRHTGEMLKYRAHSVVLAAGTLGSARIVQKSKLAAKAGIGVTDHPILYTRFALPTKSRFYHPTGCSKTVSQHLHASTTSHRYNMLLELGTGINDLQFGHKNIVDGVSYMKENAMVSEVVFILHAPLNQNNKITSDSSGNICLRIENSPVSDVELSEMQQITNQLIESLGGQPLKGDNLTLKTAGLGCVAHEVGSLSMGTVTDETCAIIGQPNIYVGDLSMFPASLAANPTLTLTAMALRLGDHLAEKMG